MYALAALIFVWLALSFLVVVVLGRYDKEPDLLGVCIFIWLAVSTAVGLVLRHWGHHTSSHLLFTAGVCWGMTALLLAWCANRWGMILARDRIKGLD